MENVLIVAQQVAILFVLMGVGAVARWKKLVDDQAIGGMVNILLLLVTPSLIIDAYQRPFASEMLRDLGLAFLIAILAHFIAIALAYLFVRVPDENRRRPLRLSVVFSNAGFMGIPLEQALFGDIGVFYGVTYVAVFNLFVWSWGYREMLGKGGVSLWSGANIIKMNMNPGTIGLALALPLFLTSTRLPTLLAVPVHHLANLNTPLAMVVIGYSLAGAKLGTVLRIPAVSVAGCLRLIVCPLLVLGVMYPFRSVLSREMMLALTVSASAPVAAMVSMFAVKFTRDVDVSVALTSGTTLLSILTMPVVIALAMAVL